MTTFFLKYFVGFIFGNSFLFMDADLFQTTEIYCKHQYKEIIRVAFSKTYRVHYTGSIIPVVEEVKRQSQGNTACHVD